MRFWLPLLLLTLPACGGSDSDAAPPVGRGTAMCHEWQTALCDTVNRCGGSAQVGVCREQVLAISCTSDEAAGNCVSALAAPSCTISDACQVRGIADPAPAVAACAEYVDTLCTASERCGADKAMCVADAQARGVCTGVIGYEPSFERCISSLKSLSCTANASPAECKSVFLK